MGVILVRILHEWYNRFVKRVEVIERIAKTFEILPKRWLVERTFGWLNRYRRLSKDYELHSENSEAMIYGSLIRLMTRRLAAV